LPPRLTTAERDLVSTPADGLVLYNTTTDTLTLRANGAWVELGAGGAGDIVNGGNTTGAAVTIGTNDAFGLNLETAGVTRMAITGGASTGGAVTITNVTANTNTVQDVLTLQTNSNGTAATLFGGGILFQGESSTTDNREMARISAIWSTATDAARTSRISFSGVNSAGAIGEVVGFESATAPYITIASAMGTTGGTQYRNNGITPAVTYTLGGSNNLTIGGSTGAVTISSTSTSASALFFNPSAATGGITIGSGTPITTTSNRVTMLMQNGWSPTSGAGNLTQLSIATPINQTGGANGNITDIYLNPTFTAINGTYKGVELTANSASAWGIYQSGASTKNYMNGHLFLGTTSDVAGYNLVSEGPIRTNAGHVDVRGSGATTASTAARIQASNTVGSNYIYMAMEDGDDAVFVTGDASEVASISAAGVWDFNYGVTGVGTTQVIYKTANETVNNSATLQDDDHLTFTVPANKKCFATFHLFLEDQD
jgi:hypothetical protein